MVCSGIDLNLANIHILYLDVKTDVSLAVYNNNPQKDMSFNIFAKAVCFLKSGLSSTLPRIYLALAFLCLLTPFPWRESDRLGQSYECHMICFSREESGGRVSAQLWLVVSKK